MRKRLPASGVAIVAPYRERDRTWLSEEIFRGLLISLCPKHVFSKKHRAKLYDRLCLVSGQWFQEKARPLTRPIAKRLERLAKAQRETEKILSVHLGGFHDSADIAAAGLIFAALKSAGSKKLKPKQFIIGWAKLCTTMAETIENAISALNAGPNHGGRPRLDWYDDFVALLQDIGSASGENGEHIGKRKKGERRWLFRAAKAFERHMPLEMRSQSDEALNERLRQSEKRLARRNPENRSGRRNS